MGEPRSILLKTLSYVLSNLDGRGKDGSRVMSCHVIAISIDIDVFGRDSFRRRNQDDKKEWPLKIVHVWTFRCYCCCRSCGYHR